MTRQDIRERAYLLRNLHLASISVSSCFEVDKVGSEERERIIFEVRKSESDKFGEGSMPCSSHHTAVSLCSSAERPPELLRHLGGRWEGRRWRGVVALVAQQEAPAQMALEPGLVPSQVEDREVGVGRRGAGLEVSHNEAAVVIPARDPLLILYRHKAKSVQSAHLMSWQALARTPLICTSSKGRMGNCSDCE